MLFMFNNVKVHEYLNITVLKEVLTAWVKLDCEVVQRSYYSVTTRLQAVINLVIVIV